MVYLHFKTSFILIFLSFFFENSIYVYSALWSHLPSIFSLPTSLGRVPINILMSSLLLSVWGVFHGTLQVTTPPKKNHSASSSSDQLVITPQPREATREPLSHTTCLVLCWPLWIHKCGSRSYPEESILNTPLHLSVMTFFFFCSLFYNITFASLVKI